MKYPQPRFSLGQVLVILLLLWGSVAIADRLWFLADRSVPAWDQADYLNGSLTYLRGLQDPQWGSRDWWTQFWQLRSKIPRFSDISAAEVQMVVGKGPDAAALVLSILSLVLLVATYAIGALVCTSQVGLWAAGLVVLLPGLYRFRLQFLLDYPLAAMVTASFAALTLWRSTDPVLKSIRNRQARLAKSRPYQPAPLSAASSPPVPDPSSRAPLATVGEWLSAIAFGMSLGLAFLTKQPALFFLAVPTAWMVGVALVKQQWGRLAQLVAAFAVSLAVWGPWYRANWLLMLTAGKRATIDSAAIEGDPPLNTLAAWTFYLTHLPRFVSLPLLLVPIAGLLTYAFGRFVTGRSLGERLLTDKRIGWREARWLGLFLVGGYLLSSLNVNKDARYILPLVPVLAVVLAAGLVALGQKGWGRHLRWATAIAGGLLAIFNLVPLGINPGIGLGWPHQPYTGQEWPHERVMDKIVQVEPYLQATVGVLPSTPSINQHNISYYGALRDWQVYGRQVGTKSDDLERDGRSLNWFLTKTGDPGSVPDTQAEMTRIVEAGGGFDLENSWTLPNDEGVLKLYRQAEPPVVVERVSDLSGDLVRLASVTVPETVLPGQPVPVTYEWEGAGAELQDGVVLLTWERDIIDEDADEERSATSDSETEFDAQAGTEEPASLWIHDRGIGAGLLRTSSEPEGGFRVTDRTAMLPPSAVDPGIYTLSATYLNRASGETYEIELSEPVQLEVATDASSVEAPELDLVTQLRTLVPQLRAGDFDPVFAEIGRINQYDPTQDYLEQAAIALEARLEDDPDNLDWLYALAIARVQQQNAPAALAALEKAAELDTDNPYAQGFVAFVHLYDWHPNLAQPWIDKAIALDPDLEEIQILDGVAALMRGNLVKAWQAANTYL